MQSCNIDTLEPVSEIRFFDIPSISTEIVGVTCFNKMEYEDFTTALSGTLRWKELPYLRLSRFPHPTFPF